MVCLFCKAQSNTSFHICCRFKESRLMIFNICAVNQQGVVKVGAVDADQHKSLGGQYGVRGFPTIKIFGANKHKPEDFQGTVNMFVCLFVLCWM